MGTSLEIRAGKRIIYQRQHDFVTAAQATLNEAKKRQDLLEFWFLATFDPTSPFYFRSPQHRWNTLQGIIAKQKKELVSLFLIEIGKQLRPHEKRLVSLYLEAKNSKLDAKRSTDFRDDPYFQLISNSLKELLKGITLNSLAIIPPKKVMHVTRIIPKVQQPRKEPLKRDFCDLIPFICLIAFVILIKSNLLYDSN